jgi:ankyrin repeat protein
VQSLLDDGADVNDRDEFHQTALLMASWEKKFEVVQLLIKYRADGVGWTPPQVASQCGHSEIVHVLLDHGADVDAKKMDGWTALHPPSNSITSTLSRLCLNVEQMPMDGTIKVGHHFN